MITINTKQASVAIGNVMRAVPRRSVVPIDQCVKLSVEDGVLIASSFNTGDGLMISDGLGIIDGAGISPVAVDAQRLNQVLRTAIGDTIKLTTRAGLLLFKSGTMSARFATQDPEMFVSRADPLDLIVEMSQKEFSVAAKSLIFLCDSIDYPGNYSEAFHIGKYFIATNNSYAVGRAFMSDDIEGSHWVPAYSINHVMRSASGPISIYTTSYGIKFVCGLLNVDVSVVENSGQDFNKAFYGIPGLDMAVVNRKRFSDLLSAAAVFAKDFSKYAEVTFADNLISINVGGDVFFASVEAKSVGCAKFGVNCEALNGIVSHTPGNDINIGCLGGRMIYVISGETEYALAAMQLRGSA